MITSEWWTKLKKIVFVFLFFFPIQVKVDSADNHDRTRKFVWQKSSHIAQVVSQKLSTVAEEFLQQSSAEA